VGRKARGSDKGRWGRCSGGRPGEEGADGVVYVLSNDGLVGLKGKRRHSRLRKEAQEF
jgi:hypothetical protein